MKMLSRKVERNTSDNKPASTYLKSSEGIIFEQKEGQRAYIAPCPFLLLLN